MGTGARHHADLVQQLILYYLISATCKGVQQKYYTRNQITHAQLITALVTMHDPYRGVLACTRVARPTRTPARARRRLPYL